MSFTQAEIDLAVATYNKLGNEKAVAEALGLLRTQTYLLLKAGGVIKEVKRLPSDDVLKSEYENGMSQRQIADKYEVTPSAVSSAMKKAGIPTRQQHKHVCKDCGSENIEKVRI